jgi:hypothetical protein
MPAINEMSEVEMSRTCSRVDAQHAVAVDLAEVGDVGAGGLEDAQTEAAERGDEGEVVVVSRVASSAEHRSNRGWLRPKWLTRLTCRDGVRTRWISARALWGSPETEEASAIRSSDAGEAKQVRRRVP